jgi:hypothetical protein
MTRRTPPKKLAPNYERAGGAARVGTAAYKKPKSDSGQVFKESKGQKTTNRGKQGYYKFRTPPAKGETKGQTLPRKRPGIDKRKIKTT